MALKLRWPPTLNLMPPKKCFLRVVRNTGSDMYGFVFSGCKIIGNITAYPASLYSYDVLRNFTSPVKFGNKPIDRYSMKSYTYVKIKIFTTVNDGGRNLK